MSFPFDSHEGLIVTQVILTGPSGSVRANLALDTGAIMTVLARRFFQALGYDLSARSNMVQVTTGSGVEFVPEITLSRIEALGHERSDFPALCHTLPSSATVDGVLGLDFLRDKRLVLDFRTGILTLD
ncbi:MAG: hypothetical protein F4X57_00185 [Chloroflexi bacterium]|nr:hypothetical protein [Chloroflexota bacterium]